MARIRIDWPAPEPPEHRACRERTRAEQYGVVGAIRRRNRDGCVVCGESHWPHYTSNSRGGAAR